MEIPQFLDQVLAQTVQITVSFPQLQFLDKVDGSSLRNVQLSPLTVGGTSASVHRQGVHELRWGIFAAEMCFFRPPSSWTLRLTQVAGTGSLNSVHMLASMDRHLRHTHCQNHHHHLKAHVGHVVVAMECHGEHGGSTRRRRQRRLRQWHRHERMTVAVALAEATHHAAPRGPKTARAQEEVERETYNVPGRVR